MAGDELSDAQAESWVVAVVGCVLVRLIEANADIQHSGAVTKFHALRPPAIKVVDYLERIQKYSSASSESFILALIYIDRLIRSNNFALTQLNAHRVIITSIMVAAKFFDDQYYNNAFYAKVGGVPSLELNSLEIEFLFRVHFTLHVTADEFYKYKAQLYNHAAAGVCSCRLSIPLQQPIALSQQATATGSSATVVADYMRQPPRRSGGAGGAEYSCDPLAAHNPGGWHEHDRPYVTAGGEGSGALRQGARSSNSSAENVAAGQYYAEHHQRGYAVPGPAEAPGAPGWWPEEHQTIHYGGGKAAVATAPQLQGHAGNGIGGGDIGCRCGQCERCYDTAVNGGSSHGSGGYGGRYGSNYGGNGAFGTAYVGGGSNAAAAAAHGCLASSQHYGGGRPRLSDRMQPQPW